MWNTLTTKPLPEKEVLLTCVSKDGNGRETGRYVTIGVYFPKGYELKFPPVTDEEDEHDFYEYDAHKDVFRYVEDMWMETTSAAYEYSGFFIGDEVVAWAEKPQPYYEEGEKNVT